jgi:hypothetical protein
MSAEEKPQAPRDWLFRGFVLGAVAGVIFGLATSHLWDWHGPYRVQISAAFWGLVFAVLGLSAGVVHRLIGRRNQPSAQQGNAGKD